ncbi:hypothetical protein SB861_29975 [Paraburkholderia sp. SIMBA_049]
MSRIGTIETGDRNSNRTRQERRPICGRQVSGEVYLLAKGHRMSSVQSKLFRAASFGGTVLIERGVLQSIEVIYARERRFARRRQVSSHRAPRYLVRYRLDNHPKKEVVAIEPFPYYFIADMRGSRPGDEIEVRLSDDGAYIIDWNNLSAQRLLESMDRTWGDSD